MRRQFEQDRRCYIVREVAYDSNLPGPEGDLSQIDFQKIPVNELTVR